MTPPSTLPQRFPAGAGVHPVTGQDSGVHAAATAAGVAASRAVRSRWLVSLTSGEATLAQAVEFSRSGGEDRYVGALRLFDILRDRPGWTDLSAREALARNGFSTSETIRSIRSSPRRTALFAAVLETAAGRWRARPPVPAGWPWRGKLAVLSAAVDAAVAVPGPPPVSTPATAAHALAGTDQDQGAHDLEGGAGAGELHEGEDLFAALLAGEDDEGEEGL